MICQKCGKKVKEGKDECPHCHTLICPHCGSIRNKEDIFCLECGNELGSTNKVIKPKKVSTDNKVILDLDTKKIQNKINTDLKKINKDKVKSTVNKVKKTTPTSNESTLSKVSRLTYIIGCFMVFMACTLTLIAGVSFYTSIKQNEERTANEVSKEIVREFFGAYTDDLEYFLTGERNYSSEVNTTTINKKMYMYSRTIFEWGERVLLIAAILLVLAIIVDKNRELSSLLIMSILLFFINGFLGYIFSSSISDIGSMILYRQYSRIIVGYVIIYLCSFSFMIPAIMLNNVKTKTQKGN